MGCFSICSKCKAAAEGICAAEGIGRETSGSSSLGNWGRKRIDSVMSECCQTVAKITLVKKVYNSGEIFPVKGMEIFLLYKRC